MLNLAINLLLFIAILLMISFVLIFFWIVAVIVFNIKEILKESDRNGQPNSKKY